MSLRRSITGTVTVLLSAALHYSLLPIVIGVVVLICVAMVIVAWAVFSRRSTPMARLRALVRDIRGDPRGQSAETKTRQT
jgi:uncharacterized membrane protein YqiK